MNYIFAKFFGLGLGLDCFWSRLNPFVLEICRSRSRSWSWKNYWVLILVLTFGSQLDHWLEERCCTV